MKGSFSEESLRQYAELAAQSKSLEFSETDVYDFTRCVRPNGTAYGTKGKCKKGTEQAKEAEPQKIKKKVITKPKEKIEVGTKEQYAALMKRQQELVSKGDMKGAMSLGPKLKALTDKIKAEEDNNPELKAKKAAEKAAMLKKLDDEDQEYAQFKLRQARHDKAQEEARAKLSSRDTKAIADYTSSWGQKGGRSYKDLNTCLRRVDECPDTAASKKFEKEFKAAITKLPKNASGDPFYRGVISPELYKQLEQAQPGTVLKDPGYGSYSANKVETNTFLTPGGKNNILFVSHNKNLTPISRFSKIESEAEAIMPSNQQQTIRAVRKDGDTLIVELD